MLFATPTLDEQDLAVLSRIDDLRRTLRYAVAEPRRWTGRLRKHAFARAIRGSNSIEGFNVTLDDAFAAAEGEEPLEAEATSWAAVTGYRQAMTFVLQLADDPYFQHSEGFLRSLHYMMMNYDLAKSPGRWRPGPIFVRDDATGKIVYQGPESEDVPGLVAELVEDLNRTDSMPSMVRAAMSHLNLVMIHPFRDGNGRMARALQTLVLAREGILAPEFSSIEEYLGRNTEAYYDVLAEVGGGRWMPERDARPWVRFTLTAHFRQATTVLRRVREAQRLWDTLDVEVRRRHLPDRSIPGLFDAALGYRIRNSTYRHGADVTTQVASRDLKRLVEAGILKAEGEKRGRHYVAAPILRDLSAQIREERVPLEDPYLSASQLTLLK